MRVAYVRVSTADQHEERQVEALKRHDIEKWYIEKMSGKDMDRPQLQAMLDFVREGDTVYIHDFSRLARSTKDLLSIVDQMEAKGVSLCSDKEQFETSTSTGKLMLTMIAAIAEFERQTLLERQREGIAIARQKGAYKGRKRVTVKDFGKYYEKYMARETTKSGLAKELGVSRPTIDRLINEHRQLVQKNDDHGSELQNS